MNADMKQSNGAQQHDHRQSRYNCRKEKVVQRIIVLKPGHDGAAERISKSKQSRARSGRRRARCPKRAEVRLHLGRRGSDSVPYLTLSISQFKYFPLLLCNKSEMTSGVS